MNAINIPSEIQVIMYQAHRTGLMALPQIATKGWKRKGCAPIIAKIRLSECGKYYYFHDLISGSPKKFACGRCEKRGAWEYATEVPVSDVCKYFRISFDASIDLHTNEMQKEIYGRLNQWRFYK